MDGLSKTWRDAGGVEHLPAKRHRRIVSLVPSLTETLCAVGGRPLLLGCTAFCTRPTDLLKAPDVAKLGGTKTVVRDRLLALNPDLLLLNLEENTPDDIEFFKTRVECYINGVKTLDDGIRTIRELGALIGEADKSAAIEDEASQTLAKVKNECAQRLLDRRPLRIAYAIWREPWMTVNRDTFIHSQLNVCGAYNVFGEMSQRYPEVTLDQIHAAAPDVVWLPSEPYRFKQKHVDELRGQLPANVRIELVDGDNVCWFGVRQIEGTRYTFKQLWGT